MRSKTFLILLIVCALLAGAIWLMRKPAAPAGGSGNDNTGRPLLADLPVNDIRRVDIKGPAGGTALVKGEPAWVVENRFGYPADFEKLTQFVLSLRDMKVDRSFAASEEILSRLSLRAPESMSTAEGAGDETGDAAPGVRVTLTDKGEKILADVMIGKPRESDAGRGGHFVMPVGDSAVYVVDQEFRFIDTKPGRWIDKQLLDVPAERIARVERLDASSDAALYTVQRADKNSPAALMDVPEGKSVQPAKVNRLMESLSGFRIEDVVDPATPAAATGLESGRCFRFTLFDGTVYTLCLGNTVAENPDQTYLRLSAGFAAPATSDGTADGDGSAADGADSKPAAGDGPKSPDEAAQPPADPALAAAETHRKLTPWIFAAAQWRVDQLIADKADFFETQEAAQE